MRKIKTSGNHCILKRVLGILLVLTVLIVQVTPRTMEKVQAADQDTEVIAWLEKMGFLDQDFSIKGIKKNPKKVITRQEYVSVLMLASGEKGSTTLAKKLNYADKNKISKKLSKYMGTAYAYGVLPEIKSTGKTYLKPTSTLTKQMAAYYMARCFNMHLDLEMTEYKDYSKISNSCAPYVTALVRRNLMSGETKTQLSPTKKMTWADAGRLIQKAYETGCFGVQNVFMVVGGDQVGSYNNDNTLQYASGITKDSYGDVIYVADTNHNQIKQIKNGVTTVLVGKETTIQPDGSMIGGYVDGNFKDAMFHHPTSICAVGDGIFVLDEGNQVIRYIDLINKKVTTYAGSGLVGHRDGEKTEASFSNPKDMVVKDGEVYIADTGNQCIRKIDTKGIVSTVAGKPGKEGYQDGEVANAMFCQPTGIEVSGDTIYVADCGNQRIRKIFDGMVSTVAGSGEEKDANSNEYLGGYADGTVSDAQFRYPTHIELDTQGNLYVSDTGNGMIRKITEDTVTTVAGFGNCVTKGQFNWQDYLVAPNYLMISDDGTTLYISDSFKNQVIALTIQ